MTLLVAYRTFGNAPADPESQAVESVQLPDEVWRELIADREFVGSATPSVKVVEFVDFECPACRRDARIVDSALKLYPDELAFSYAHFPLEYHRFALPAARAADCAYAQGRFYEMGRSLLLGQDSLGMRSWNEFAREAGVESLDDFGECVDSSGPIARLERDRAIAEKVVVPATPTFVVNGTRLADAFTISMIDSIVRATREPR